MSDASKPFELGKPVPQSYHSKNYDYEAMDTRNRFAMQKPEMLKAETDTQAMVVSMVQNMQPDEIEQTDPEHVLALTA